MKVHNRETPLLGPGVCFLCEQSPFEGEPVVDVERHFDDAAIQTRLDGRKYVCVRCASEVAGLFGFISPEKAQELSDEAAAARAEAASANASVDLQAAIEAAAKQLGVVRVADTRAENAVVKHVAVEPKPKKKAAAKKA